jgi:DNA polymerase
MLVGEQPGDREDREGRPFVGPAGRVLADALDEAGIDPKAIYLTNAVKHFKWRAGRGKRRLHQRPNVEEIRACGPWLDAELKLVRPEGLVCMGATAARAVLGPGISVTKDRGRFLDSDLATCVAVTFHPSAILRVRDRDERREGMAQLVSDLHRVADRVGAA